jgi:phosphoribosylformylglycinamidine (FGAM) synthase-like amidotransferase family enzyme
MKNSEVIKGEIIDSYPCDVNGSNESIENIVKYEGKKYIVITDWEGNVLYPNKKATERE